MELKNKKGQVYAPFFLFMVGVIIFIIVFALAVPLTKSTNTVMTSLDCSNSSIETYQKVQCSVVDLVSPFIIAVIFALGGIIITARLVG